METEWIECTDVEARDSKKAQAMENEGDWKDVKFTGDFPYWVANDSPPRHVVGRRWRRAVEEPEIEYDEWYITVRDGIRYCKHLIVDSVFSMESFVCFRYANGDTAPTPTLPLHENGHHTFFLEKGCAPNFTWDHATHVVFLKERAK